MNQLFKGQISCKAVFSKCAQARYYHRVLAATEVYSRAAQNFWGLISQTPNWRLPQNVKVCEFSGPSRDIWSRPQSPETKRLGPFLQVRCLSLGFCGRDQTSQEGPETWCTFTFWANLKFGVWGMRPQKFLAALVYSSTTKEKNALPFCLFHGICRKKVWTEPNNYKVMNMLFACNSHAGRINLGEHCLFSWQHHQL